MFQQLSVYVTALRDTLPNPLVGQEPLTSQNPL